MPIEQTLAFLERWAKEHSNERDKESPCYPRRVPKTWAEASTSRLLRKKREIVLKNLVNNNDSRAPLVIAVVAGFGNGKTHFLKAAPRFVGQKGLYVTYNLDQDLSIDQSHTRRSLLIRIIFETYGTGSCGAANFLTGGVGERFVNQSNFEGLLAIASQRLNDKFAGQAGFFVCVDEVRKVEKINPGGTSSILSTLGELAQKVYGLSSLKCTAIVSALDDEGIKIFTGSNREVETLRMPLVDASAVEFISDALALPEGMLWKVATVAGRHMRSIVSAVDTLIEENNNVSIERLMILSYERLRSKVSFPTSLDIEKYLKNMMEKGCKVAPPASLKEICSTDNAVPPLLVCAAYRDQPELQKYGEYEYLKNIFQNDMKFTAFDQLELSARNYDLFRSTLGAPVVPSSLQMEKSPDWYKELKFPPLDKKVSKESILVVRGKEVQWSGLTPVVGTYYHPGLKNHPWIDRFFIATGTEERQCLVLYQDKINARGFPNAVSDLNRAADVLKSNLSMPVLVIANVIGASGLTRARNEFSHPYLLVRGNELDEFYTRSFAPAFKFLLTRFEKNAADSVIAA